MPTNLRTAFTTLCTLALLTCASPADTVTLKDGTVIDGTITAETDTQVKIEIILKGSITDLKTIDRADIAEISKLTEEDLAAAKIKSLLPTPSLLSASNYETMIRSQVELFLNTYPSSKYKAEIEEVLATLNEEFAKASKGAIKIEDTWITAAEQKFDRANVDARILHFQMSQKAAGGDHTGALRDFDKLAADYPGTKSHADAIGDALEILPAYGRIIASQQRDFEARMKQRAEDLQLLPEHKRAENEAFFKKEQDGYKAAADRDKKLGYRWPALNPNYKPGLDEIAKLIAADTKKLNEIDTAPLKAAASALAKVQAFIGERKLAQAKAGFELARKSVKGGLYLANVQANIEQLEATLADEAADAKKSESEKALETMNAYKTDGASAGSASTVNPLDEVMKRRREAAEKEAEKGKAGTKSAAKEKPKSKPATTTATKPAPSSGGGGIGFSTIIMIVAFILVLVTGGVFIMQKKKGG